MNDLVLDSGWVIDASDFTVRHARSSGPGGQNVNKLATKVELRLHLSLTPALSGAQKQRLAARYPSHVTSDGDFLVTSERFRSQARNLKDATERLTEMILSVRRPPKKRVATRATKASKRKRLDDKRKRGDVKRQRRPVND